MLKELKKELREARKEDAWTQNDVFALHATYLKDNPKCEKCGRIDDLTVDHIVPKSLMFQFGIDVTRTFNEKWIRTLCYRCNRFKANQLDFTDPRTKTILLELLERV